MLVKIANPTLIYKDWDYSQSLATLLLMQQDQLYSTILEVGMYLLASARILPKLGILVTYPFPYVFAKIASATLL